MAKHRRADGDPPSILVLPQGEVKSPLPKIKVKDSPYCGYCDVLVYVDSPGCKYQHDVNPL
ncbi:hypothetical protein SEA_OLGASCLOVER_64 [Gordonia phage OlgasClover]|nr:hypothetical protein SEA_OLGASCLOVER_64 [Gordonia phage OlgasClover]